MQEEHDMPLAKNRSAKRYVLIAGITIAVIAAVAAGMLLRGGGNNDSPAPAAAPEETRAQITDIANQIDINPAENLPDTNPFDANTNPFKTKVKTNPFAQ